MKPVISSEFFAAPIAHRALHDKTDGRTENSTSAILAGVKAGFAIEIDIQCTRDGQAVVFHDYVLDRMTSETGLLKDRNLKDLCKIERAGGGGAIASLRSVLDLVAGQVPVLVEIKDQSGGMNEDIGLLEQAVAKDLHGYRGPVAVMSFNPYSVAEFAKLAPQVARGLTTRTWAPPAKYGLPEEHCQRLTEMPDLERIGASFISHDVNDLENPRVAEAKQRGLAIFCWTVKSPQQEEFARAIADNVTFEGYLPPATK